MTTPYRVSEETLGMSSMQRGLPGMVSKVAPGPNMFDGSPTTNPMGGGQHQLASNERLKLQEMSRNIESAGPQASAGAARAVGQQVNQAANAENKAQALATQRQSEILYANQSGSALMQLNETMGGPDRAKFLNDIATGKAMAAGLNPDLGAEVAAKARYIR